MSNVVQLTCGLMFFGQKQFEIIFLQFYCMTVVMQILYYISPVMSVNVCEDPDLLIFTSGCCEMCETVWHTVGKRLYILMLKKHFAKTIFHHRLLTFISDTIWLNLNSIFGCTIPLITTVECLCKWDHSWFIESESCLHFIISRAGSDPHRSLPGAVILQVPVNVWWLLSSHPAVSWWPWRLCSIFM